MRALLDVNVLIALLDQTHAHHPRAQAWLEANIQHGWASCPLTENGCTRVMSQPNYANAVPVTLAASRLAEARQTDHHRFWPDALSLLDPTKVDLSYALGPKQLTDIYLLALAVYNGGRLVTFDRRIALQAVPAAAVGSLVRIP